MKLLQHWLRYFLAILWASVGTTTFAGDWKPVRELHIFKLHELKEFGVWERTESEQHLFLKCTTCQHRLEIKIEIITPYSSVGNFTNGHSKYLFNRKRHCAELAFNFTGRCIETQKSSLRSMLSGYVSTSEIQNNLFHYERVYLFGDVALVGSVIGVDGTDLTQLATGLTDASLTRLTVAW